MFPLVKRARRTGAERERGGPVRRRAGLATRRLQKTPRVAGKRWRNSVVGCAYCSGGARYGCEQIGVRDGEIARQEDRLPELGERAVYDGGKGRKEPERYGEGACEHGQSE